MTREQALKEVYGISANKKQHEALQILIPELRESEDERVKKALIDLVCTVGEYYLKPDSRNRMLAWLEKQKEQKPNCKYECPLTDKQLMATDFWKAYLKESLIPGAKPNKQDIEFLLPTARNYFSLIMKDACTICKDWSNGYRKGLESGEQKSVEWSEEDEYRRDWIIQCLCEYKKEFNPKYESLSIESIESLIDWLESLPLNLKKKNEDVAKLCSNEWGEEEEKKMIFLERLIEHNVPDGQYGWADGRKGGFVTKSEAISMLKSFRPQYHGDVTMTEAYKMGLEAGKASSWKPSKEQIGALNYAYGELFKREDVGHNILGPLQKLCDELRNLSREIH